MADTFPSLAPERFHRVVMAARGTTWMRTSERERVHHRSRAGFEVELIETATPTRSAPPSSARIWSKGSAYRSAHWVSPQPGPLRQVSRYRVAPMWTTRLIDDTEPHAKVAGLVAVAWSQGMATFHMKRYSAADPSHGPLRRAGVRRREAPANRR